jgi:hypothetical protein
MLVGAIFASLTALGYGEVWKEGNGACCVRNSGRTVHGKSFSAPERDDGLTPMPDTRGLCAGKWLHVRNKDIQIQRRPQESLAFRAKRSLAL